MAEAKPAPTSEAASDADDERPVVMFIAGFGDNASMFSGLLETHLARTYRLLPIDLPGFGAPPPEAETTLSSLANFVAEQGRGNRCRDNCGPFRCVDHRVARCKSARLPDYDDCFP